jgi:hypothetical protein
VAVRTPWKGRPAEFGRNFPYEYQGALPAVGRGPAPPEPSPPVSAPPPSRPAPAPTARTRPTTRASSPHWCPSHRETCSSSIRRGGSPRPSGTGENRCPAGILHAFGCSARCRFRASVPAQPARPASSVENQDRPTRITGRTTVHRSTDQAYQLSAGWQQPGSVTRRRAGLSSVGRVPAGGCRAGPRPVLVVHPVVSAMEGTTPTRNLQIGGELSRGRGATRRFAEPGPAWSISLRRHDGMDHQDSNLPVT